MYSDLKYDNNISQSIQGPSYNHEEAIAAAYHALYETTNLLEQAGIVIHNQMQDNLNTEQQLSDAMSHCVLQLIPESMVKDPVAISKLQLENEKISNQRDGYSNQLNITSQKLQVRSSTFNSTVNSLQQTTQICGSISNELKTLYSEITQ